MQVFRELTDVDKEENDSYRNSYHIKYTPFLSVKLNVGIGPWIIDVCGADRNNQQAYFRGTQFTIGETKLIDNNG